MTARQKSICEIPKLPNRGHPRYTDESTARPEARSLRAVRWTIPGIDRDVQSQAMRRFLAGTREGKIEAEQVANGNDHRVAAVTTADLANRCESEGSDG